MTNLGAPNPESVSVPPIAEAMCVVGLATMLLGAWVTWRELRHENHVDLIGVVSAISLAVPLAIFGTLHFVAPDFVAGIVPSYLPWRLAWVYLVGAALFAAAMGLASRRAIRWAGLGFGTMMLLFVAMVHLPGAISAGGDRFLWTIVLRETSFGGGGLLIAATADGWRPDLRLRLIRLGSILVLPALVLFGLEHLLHPTGLPGVPLQRLMPAWVPAKEAIGFLTGAGLLLTGGSVMLRRGVRTIATAVAAWLGGLILAIYLPVLVTALQQPAEPARVEGVNYFADTLLFTAVLLALAASRTSLRGLLPNANPSVPPSVQRSEVG